MAAIAYPRADEGTDVWGTGAWGTEAWDPGWYDPAIGPERVPLHLVPPAPRRARRRATARIYHRRRVVLACLAAFLLLATGALLGRLGGGPLTTPEPAPTHASAPKAIHVVQQGDTLWAIARALHPTGDVRPLVDKLEAQRHGQPLRVGEVVTLP